MFNRFPFVIISHFGAPTPTPINRVFHGLSPFSGFHLEANEYNLKKLLLFGLELHLDYKLFPSKVTIPNLFLYLYINPNANIHTTQYFTIAFTF